MATANDVQVWLAGRVTEDEALYRRYGAPLEAEHAGEFVAIGPHGQVIVGPDEVRVAKQAIEELGAGNFTLRRIGSDAEIRWRRSA